MMLIKLLVMDDMPPQVQDEKNVFTVWSRLCEMYATYDKGWGFLPQQFVVLDEGGGGNFILEHSLKSRYI
jgi:hypothetical protein